MKRVLRTTLILSLAVVGLIGPSSIASADAPDPVDGPGPFLCPIVGEGVNNADSHNGDHGVSAGAAYAGTTFIPGNNQSGDHANYKALNPQGPEVAPGPGNGNSDWSPIWPYHP